MFYAWAHRHQVVHMASNWTSLIFACCLTKIHFLTTVSILHSIMEASRKASHMTLTVWTVLRRASANWCSVFALSSLYVSKLENSNQSFQFLSLPWNQHTGVCTACFSQWARVQYLASGEKQGARLIINPEYTVSNCFSIVAVVMTVCEKLNDDKSVSR